MTQTPESNRMDRIERALDGLATNLINERDARWVMREDLEDFYHTVRGWAESIDGSILHLTDRLDRLTEKVDRVTDRVDRLTELMGQFAQEAREDRAAIREVQAENRQIWQYLLSQRPNGSSDR